MKESKVVVEAPFSYAPLTPASFLARSALVFAERTAVVDGDQSWTYAEFGQRARRLAGMLAGLRVAPGDRVAVLAPNTHMLLEAHHGVPLCGGVLVALNSRLNGDELGTLLGHSGARILLFDRSLASSAAEAAARCGGLVRLVEAGHPQSEYESLIAAAPEVSLPVDDERSLLSINYTSGTTGGPKGVMYHHRGAYLQALAMAFHTRLDIGSAYLWTLPMFHCNGWCFTWAVTAAGGRHICLPRFDPAEVWRLFREEGVTHLSAAPSVLTMLANDKEAAPVGWPLRIATGGAPPSPALIARLSELSIHITHLYGLTETFGPIALCEWKPEWDDLPAGDQARLRARQGVSNVIACPLRVVDENGTDVPADGETVGELVARGNDVMLGYYRDPEATAASLVDGWFKTGDVAVMHPDGYVEIRDRSKDVIITGGENVASIEVEQVLVSHPAVLEAAVVAAPDPVWGEVPVAYVTLKDGQQVTDAELIEYARKHLAHFKCPKQVLFEELPKTSTGKVEKYVLRARAAALEPVGLTTLT